MKATDPTKAKGEATRRSPANVLRSTLFPDSSRMSWLDALDGFSVCVCIMNSSNSNQFLPHVLTY